MTNIKLASLQSTIQNEVARLRPVLVDYRLDVPPLQPFLRNDDIHSWVHIAHLTQIIGFARSFSDSLEVADTVDPLVFAALARPAWEAALQLGWIHTDEKALGVRWFDYAYFKAILDRRGGKSVGLQRGLLVSLSSASAPEKDWRLLRRLCRRYLSRDALDEALQGISSIREEDELFYAIEDWMYLSYEEEDDYWERQERNRVEIKALQPLAHFLKAVQKQTGWRYPLSWTNASVRSMLEDIEAHYGLRRDWDLVPPAGYKDYQRLSEAMHCAGPTVLHLLVTDPDPRAPGLDLIEWAGQVMLDALDRATWIEDLDY